LAKARVSSGKQGADMQKCRSSFGIGGLEDILTASVSILLPVAPSVFVDGKVGIDREEVEGKIKFEGVVKTCSV
jgi:hypothetical protein